MPLLSSVLTTAGNVASAGARMYGSYEAGKEQGREKQAAMRRKMLEEALLDLRAHDQETQGELHRRQLADYLSPPDKAALDIQTDVKREEALGPVRTQNAVGQATALGPVQAANAARTEAATRPGRLATALGIAQATAPVQQATHQANRAYDIAHPMPTTTSPESEVGYYQTLVDDAMNAAGGDVHDAWNKAIRLDSRARPLILAGKITHTDFEAGVQRWRNRETLVRQREAGLQYSDPGYESSATSPVRQDEAPRTGPTPLNQHPTSARTDPGGDINLGADPKAKQRADWDRAAQVLRARGENPEATLGKRPAPSVPLDVFVAQLRARNPSITKDQARELARSAGYNVAPPDTTSAASRR